MDTWTDATQMTSEQKNFLLLSSLYKIMFTHMCVRACTRIHTWVDWARSPESSEEGGHQTRCWLGGGERELGCCPRGPFSGGQGPRHRRSVCI